MRIVPLDGSPYVPISPLKDNAAKHSNGLEIDHPDGGFGTDFAQPEYVLLAIVEIYAFPHSVMSARAHRHTIP